MSKKKIAVVLASTALIASLVIGGTLAYLTDSDTVTNTFTLGDIAITLDEPSWDDTLDGKDLLPGAPAVAKDPTVTATKGDSYMRIKLAICNEVGTPITVPTDTVDLAAYEARMGLIMGTIGVIDTLKFTKETTTNAGVFYYNYDGVFSENDIAVLFTEIQVPKEYDRDDVELMDKYSIVLTAQAIQSTGFDNATDAFAELDLAI